MKKSKIIIPALALMAFSLAASITGTVAWFTANRVATVKASSFAVVNTTTDLQVTLADGLGTTTNNTTKEVSVIDGYKLTDGSLDHRSLNHEIIAPEETGEKVGSAVALASASLSDLERDAQTSVYTAFTWDMTFTVSFGGSAGSDAGLFLDLSGTESYMHKKLFVAEGATIPANSFSDEACTTAKSGTGGSGGEYVYQVAPVETGKAFRIAFIPKAIAGSGVNESKAYAKVWAKNEASTDCGFVDVSDTEYGIGADLADVEASYGTATTKLVGHTGSTSASAEALGSGMVLMDSACNGGIPQNNTKTEAQALASNNYLGLFKLDAGKNVSITFTCVAWFDGTDVESTAGHIVSNATDFETIVSAMKFGVSNLAPTI